MRKILIWVRWLFLQMWHKLWIWGTASPTGFRFVRRTLSRHPSPIRAQPKPRWVRNEVIKLKALMPQAGCRTIAHCFNRRWAVRREMSPSCVQG